MNIERYASSSTTVLVHDCNPIDELSAARERETRRWTGDIWKLIVCLKQWRPDLQVAVVDVPPSGLAIITGLDPGSTVLADNYAAIMEQYLDLPFKYLEEEGQSKALNVVANDWDKVQTILPDRRRKLFSVSLVKSQRVLSAAIRSTAPKARGRLRAMTRTRP
jgi:hypothetical protein